MYYAANKRVADNDQLYTFKYNLTNSDSTLQKVMFIMLSWRVLKSNVLAMLSTSAAAAAEKITA